MCTGVHDLLDPVHCVHHSHHCDGLHHHCPHLLPASSRRPSLVVEVLHVRRLHRCAQRPAVCLCCAVQFCEIFKYVVALLCPMERRLLPNCFCCEVVNREIQSASIIVLFALSSGPLSLSHNLWHNEYYHLSRVNDALCFMSE